MLKILARIVGYLPQRRQQGLKRWYYGSQIRRGSFKTSEAEFARLEEWIGAGDWVLDIGANVGHYSKRISEIVGAAGRVIAIEPVPQTFELLSANAALFPASNITLLNVAASETAAVLGMSVPTGDASQRNYYRASVVDEKAEFTVLSLPIDSLGISKTVRLAKIDVEGHELSVLKGMVNIIKRDHPVLIIEGKSGEVASYLKEYGYSFTESDGSENRVFRCKG